MTALIERASRKGATGRPVNHPAPIFLLGSQGSASGHEDAFPQPRLSAHCWFSQRTFAGARGNGEVAPSAVIRGTASLQPGSTRNRSFIKHHRMRAAAGGDDNAAHGGRSLCGR